MKLRLIGIILSLILIPIGCNASNCPALYPNTQPIEIKNTVELCNSFYVSLYDKQNQRVILVSEHLKHGGIGSAERDNLFHSDARIGHNPSPTQYRDTGYDKGHMAPAGDASNDKEMYETFAMTNMTPQKPLLNRESWRMLEEHTRTLFSKSKSDMYVVNIAVYVDNNRMNGIPIPTGYWKIITVDGTTTYYYAENKDNAPVVQKPRVVLQSLLPQ
jgi:endonuclease G